MWGPPLEGEARMYYADLRTAKALMDARLGIDLSSARQPASGGLAPWLDRTKSHWLHRAGLRLVTLGERLQARDQPEPSLRQREQPA